MTDIATAIKQLAKRGEVSINHLQNATVVSVDWPARTCKVRLDDGRLRSEVKLRAVADDGATGICLKPKVGSAVVIAAIEREEMNAVVVGYTDVDRFEVQMQDIGIVWENGKVSMEVKNLEVKADQTTFNNGSLGGLIKLLPALQKINALEGDLNSIKAVFAAWVPVPQDGGLALKTAAAAWAGKTFTLTQQSELENTKIKQ